MRKLALAAGLLIALLAAAALLLPRYLDWNALKPEIAAAARQLSGHEIVIDGEVGVALLPTPVLTATRVRLPGQPGMPEPLRLQAMELRLAPAALLSGEIRFAQLRLIGPRITVARHSDGRHNWSWMMAPAEEELPRRFSLEKVLLQSGTLVYHDNEGTQWRLDKLDVSASLESLAGPLSARGGFVAAGLPLSFALQLGRRNASGVLTVSQLSLSLPDDAGRLDFRRRSNADDDRVLSGRLSVISRDLARAAGVLGWPGALPRVPLAIDARLQAEADEAAINDLRIRLAEAQLGGAVLLSFGERPRFDGALTAGRFDLDALLRAKASPRQGAAPAASLSAPVWSWRLLQGLTGALDIEIEGLSWREATVRQVQLAATLADGSVRIDAARALLPGDAGVSLTGAISRHDDAPRFDGRIEFEAGNLQRLLGWLGFDHVGLGADRLTRLSLATELSITTELLQARNAAIRLDGTRAEGALTYRLRGRPSFGLDLALDDLDLGDYLPPPSANIAYPLALLQRFDANLKLSAKRLGWGARSARGVSLDLGLVQGQLTVREARIADIAGSHLQLHASAGGLADRPSYIGDLELTSADPRALAQALGLPAPTVLAGLAPLTLNARLEGQGAEVSLQASGRLRESAFELEGEIAGLASELSLDLAARVPGLPLGQLAAALGVALPDAVDEALPVAIEGRLSGTLAPLALTLDAEAAGASLELGGSIDAASTPAPFDLAVKAAHADAAQLLRRLGLERLARRFTGPLAFSARLKGTRELVQIDDAELRLGEDRLAAAIAIASAGPRPRIEGRLGLGTLDLTPWLSPSAPEGGGQLTAAPGVPDLVARCDGRLALDADRLVFGRAALEEVAATLTLERGIFGIEQLSGRLFGGTVKLSGRLVAGAPAALGLTASLDEADLNLTLGSLLGNEALQGRLSLTAELQSLGDDVAALARNLTGGLEVEARDGVVRGLDLVALDEAIAQGLASEDVAAFVERAMTSGQTALLAAHGRWRLGAGVLTADDSRISLQGAEARLAGELASDGERLALRLELRPTALPQGPGIIVELTGSPAAPEVALDAAAFSNHLARQGRKGAP